MRRVLAPLDQGIQIARVHLSPPAAPYALATPRFRFRALALLAGRAPLGGMREVAMAAYITARLADDARRPAALADATRKARAAAAKTWLASLALPAAARTAFTRLVDATSGDGSGLHPALVGVIDVTRGQLDGAAKIELEALLQTIGA